MLSHSWLKECVRMFGVADNITSVLFNSMKEWKTELTSGGEVLGEVRIKRGIFQGDSLSPLLFVMVLIPLTMVLKSTGLGYRFSKDSLSLNHLLFMDDLKLYAKTERELNSLVHTVRVISDDIGMVFGLDKCKTVCMRKGRIVDSNGIKMPNGEEMKQIEDTGYKYLGMFQDEGIKTF